MSSVPAQAPPQHRLPAAGRVARERRKNKRPARRACQTGGGPFIMTSLKTTSGDRLPENGLPLESRTNSDKTQCQAFRVRIAEKAATANRCTNHLLNKVPVSRDIDRWTISRFGVGRRARVAHTAVRQWAIRMAQRAHRRGGCQEELRPGGKSPEGKARVPSAARSVLAWRAADTSRPWAPVTRRPVSSAYVALPTVEKTSPSLPGHASLAPGQGWGAPPPTSHRAGVTEGPRMHVVTGHSETTRSIVRAIERLAAAGHLETRTQRVDATWAYGQPGMVSLTLIMTQDEIEDAREAPAMVAVPLVGATRHEEPRSHAPNICGHWGGDVVDPCAASIAWSAGSPPPGPTPGWYHLDPEITDHEAVPGA